MNDNTVENLTAQLLTCQDEKEALRDEIERLKAQLTNRITEMEHKQQIARDNAYADGFRDGQADRRRG